MHFGNFIKNSLIFTAGAFTGAALTDAMWRSNPFVANGDAHSLWGMSHRHSCYPYARSPWSTGHAMQRAHDVGYLRGQSDGYVQGYTDRALEDARYGRLGRISAGEGAYLLEANRQRMLAEIASIYRLY